MSIRLIVKHSSIPSRRLSAASGCSLSSHFASFSSFPTPSFTLSFQAARIRDLVCSCWSFGNLSATFRSLCWRHLCTRLALPNTALIAARNAFEPSITNRRRRSGFDSSPHQILEQILRRGRVFRRSFL